MLVVATTPYIISSVNADTETYDYLILTTDDLSGQFGGLINLNQNRDLTTIIKTLSDVDDIDGDGVDPEEIRSYIIDKHVEWEFDYLLLGGDSEKIPVRQLSIDIPDSIVGLPAGNYRVPADMYYGCLDGPFNGNNNGKWGETDDGEGGGDVDLHMDICVGRACISDTTEAQNFVTKTSNYFDNNFYNFPYLTNMLAVGEWTTDRYGGQWLETNIINPHINTDVNNGGYLLTELYERDMDWEISNLLLEINKGINFLIHYGHGFIDKTMNGWTGTGLENNGEPFFLYSGACNIGRFGTELEEINCFAEVLGPQNTVGAFALVVNSDSAPSSFTDEIAQAFWGNIKNNQRIGMALKNAKNSCNPSNIYMRMQIFEMNLLGDPAMTLAPPSPPAQKPTAEFTIEPSVVKIGETVWLNSSEYSHDNDENGESIEETEWCITFNPSKGGEYDCELPLQGEEVGSGGETNDPIYRYEPDIILTFDKKGYYDISLTVKDDEDQYDTKSVPKAIRVNIRVDLNENESVALNPSSSNPWFCSPALLINYPFLLLNRSPNNPPDSNSSGGSSSQNSSNPNSNPLDPVKITLLLPFGPETIEENETVEFIVEVENGTGDNYVILDFGDGTIYSDYMGWDHNVYHTYTAVGTYCPDVEVHDLQSNCYDHYYDYASVIVSESNPLGW